MALPRSGRPEQAAGPAARLTGRGAVLIMAGFFLIGCVLAARYTVPADLLTVVTSPPLLFVALVVLVSAVTGPGSLLLSVVVGCVATLTGAAPWLAVGMALTVGITWARGLPRCIQDLRRE